MNKHPDCEDRCQILEHKGYHTCSQTGQCEQLAEQEMPSEPPYWTACDYMDSDKLVLAADYRKLHAFAVSERERRVKVEGERDEWRRALTGLTAGGSEFTSPQPCVDYVRSVRQSQHDVIVSFKQRAETAERSLAAARAEERERCKTACEDERVAVASYTGAMLTTADEAYNLAIKHCVAAIHALGDK